MQNNGGEGVRDGVGVWVQRLSSILSREGNSRAVLFCRRSLCVGHRKLAVSGNGFLGQQIAIFSAVYSAEFSRGMAGLRGIKAAVVLHYHGDKGSCVHFLLDN